MGAGVSEAESITDMSFDRWRHVMSVNLDGAFLTLQATLRYCVDGASIVAVSSVSGFKAAPMIAAYGASKAGFLQLVKVAVLEGAGRKIRVNAIAPGGVKTPTLSTQNVFVQLESEYGSEAGAWAAKAQGTPLGCFAESDEITRLIALLLGPDAGIIKGSVLSCDGGYGL